MSDWPLPFKLRLAGAAGVLVVVVVVLLVTGGGGGSERALVPVTAEEWHAGQEAGGWVPVEVPLEAAELAVPPAELSESRIAAFDLPAGTIVTAEMLREPGAQRVDNDATTVWIAADTGRWHNGPSGGDRAVFASQAAGCAALELELVDVDTGQVAVAADPELFAALVIGEPWTVWASPAAGWGAQCPADTTVDFLETPTIGGDQDGASRSGTG